MAGISAFRSDDARVAYYRRYEAVLATSTVPVTESDVETSFGRTHLLSAGDPSNPQLVALHGSSISSTSWIPHLPVLTRTHSVTMIDAIDEAGKSIASKPTRNSAEIVAWLDDTLRMVGIRRSAMVAASRGAWMATHYAIAYPERVERLALICPVGVVKGMRLRWMVRALATMSYRPTERRIDSFLDTMVMPPNTGMLRQEPWRPIIQQFVGGAIGFRAAVDRASPKPIGKGGLQRLSASGIPVLAIIGRDESLHNGHRFAGRLRRQLPEARVELVDDANHLVMVDQPDIVETMLTEFLQ